MKPDNRVIELGGRVKYSAVFLRQIQAPPTDDLWRLTGTVRAVREVGGLRLVTVEWADGTAGPILSDNLCLAGELSRRTACI
jgi:hypothetical protein